MFDIEYSAHAYDEDRGVTRMIYYFLLAVVIALIVLLRMAIMRRRKRLRRQGTRPAAGKRPRTTS